MKFQEKYKLWIEDFSCFRFHHKVGGNLLFFLANMGIWNLLAQISSEKYFSNFTVQLVMSLVFTAAFYVRKNPKEQ
ncbi:MULTISPECIES: hypothetical protein [unclassified Alteromonas]|uniref:hypothetical protein n=1 Tax=unclassified Alteromonas TaxID=2614992 RepID=UPI00050985C8|nr:MULTISPECIES: hypothetical protein [unclassified Alteromonas]